MTSPIFGEVIHMMEADHNLHKEQLVEAVHLDYHIADHVLECSYWSDWVFARH